MRIWNTSHVTTESIQRIFELFNSRFDLNDKILLFSKLKFRAYLYSVNSSDSNYCKLHAPVFEPWMKWTFKKHRNLKIDFLRKAASASVVANSNYEIFDLRQLYTNIEFRFVLYIIHDDRLSFVYIWKKETKIKFHSNWPVKLHAHELDYRNGINIFRFLFFFLVRRVCVLNAKDPGNMLVVGFIVTRLFEQAFNNRKINNAKMVCIWSRGWKNWTN